MTRTSLLIAGLLAALPAGGCCTMARFFCGADDTPWVPISFASPDATLATFREAFRKDDAVQLSACLSERLKASLGIGGAVEVRFVKDRIAAEAPGVHMVGYAEVETREALSPDAVVYRLEVAGRRFAVTLVRQAFWEVRAYDPAEPFAAPRQDGAWVAPAQLPRYAWVRSDAGRSKVTLELPTVELDALEPGRLQYAGVGFEWKVDGFEVPRAD